MASMKRYAVYTDGGAAPNPGPGGWGALVVDQESGQERELSGVEGATTNNRMELTAAISALEAIEPGARVDLYTDSQYLRQGITTWLRSWIRRNWQRARDAGPVLNVDLWKRLDHARTSHDVHWHWIKGHAGHPENERVDALATAARATLGTAKAPAASAPFGGHLETAKALPRVSAHLRVTCRNGRGRWLALLITADEERELRGEGVGTTANRLELEAALAVLAHTTPTEPLLIHATDYVRRGASEWLEGWKSRGWRTGSGDPVKNAEIWRQLDRALIHREVAWEPPAADKDRAKEIDRRLSS
jgi:ribonuclease HI